MALFVDGPVSSIEDLAAQDSQLLEVASTEGIDLGRKLAAAQDDLAVELTVLLNRLRSVDQAFGTAANPGPEYVVVTPALKLWHTYLSLEMVYRDAYSNQLNDRYAGKRDQFHQMAQWANEKFIQIGVGLTANPVPRAATPQVTEIPGALADGTYYVSTAWVNGGGEEGASATPAAITIANSALQVQTETAPPRAVGWNVFIGEAPESLVLQNSSPIAAGQTWQQGTPPATAGRAPGTGQQPTYLKPIPRLIQRG